MSKINNNQIIIDTIKSQYEVLANSILPQSEQFSNSLLEFHKK